MARPKGSENKDKPFKLALQMELAAAGENHKTLRAIARNLISMAASGGKDALGAIKEIADRMDGKAVQQIDANVEATRYVIEVPAMAKSVEEWSESVRH